MQAISDEEAEERNREIGGKGVEWGGVGIWVLSDPGTPLRSVRFLLFYGGLK